MQTHNSEVDSSDKVLGLIKRLGGSTNASSCSGDYGTYPDVPVFNADDLCYYSSESRLLTTFDCGKLAYPKRLKKQRLCYCYIGKYKNIFSFKFCYSNAYLFKCLTSYR